MAMTKITLIQRIEIVEWVTAMGFSFYSITQAKNTIATSPVKEIRVPTMSDLDQSYQIDDLKGMDQDTFVAMLTDKMEVMLDCTKADRLLRTPFDEVLETRDYTYIHHMSNKTVSRWTNGNLHVSCDSVSWSINHHSGTKWEMTGISRTLLAEALDSRKL